MMRASICDLSSVSAPTRPVSSSVVNTHSSAGCTRASSSSTHIMSATATPLSAPSVVPFAESTPSFTTRSMPSCSKSCSTPARLSHTMSMWPCSMTAGASSAPALAGFLMMTLYTSSW